MGTSIDLNVEVLLVLPTSWRVQTSKKSSVIACHKFVRFLLSEEPALTRGSGKLAEIWVNYSGSIRECRIARPFTILVLFGTVKHPEAIVGGAGVSIAELRKTTRPPCEGYNMAAMTELTILLLVGSTIVGSRNDFCIEVSRLWRRSFWETGKQKITSSSCCSKNYKIVEIF